MNGQTTQKNHMYLNYHAPLYVPQSKNLDNLSCRLDNKPKYQISSVDGMIVGFDGCWVSGIESLFVWSWRCGGGGWISW